MSSDESVSRASWKIAGREGMRTGFAARNSPPGMCSHSPPAAAWTAVWVATLLAKVDSRRRHARRPSMSIELRRRRETRVKISKQVGWKGMGVESGSLY